MRGERESELVIILAFINLVSLMAANWVCDERLVQRPTSMLGVVVR